MVDKKEKAEPKAAAKKVAAPKAEVKVKKDAAPKKEAAASAPAAKEKKAAPSGKTITITQVGSPIGRQDYQRATLIGLGLNKIRRSRTIIDTPATRGMIEKVKHLIQVSE